MNQAEAKTAKNPQLTTGQPQGSCSNLNLDEDLKAEKILAENIKTPIGMLLGKIAELPQVRHEKVLSVRRELSKGSYKVETRLDSALDKIIEELIIQP